MPSDRTGVPGQFRRWVHDVLPRLYDAAYVGSHPLLIALVPPERLGTEEQVYALREAVLQAITGLRPDRPLPPSDPSCRPYWVLRYRYVEGMSPEEVQERLAISRRQFFREQQRALTSLARSLWEGRPGVTSGQAPDSGITAELDGLSLARREFSLQDCVSGALALVGSLAEAHGVQIDLTGDETARAFADETVVRQVVVTMLSCGIESVPGSPVEANLQRQAASALVSVVAHGQAVPKSCGPRLEVAAQLADRVGCHLDVREQPGNLVLTLGLPSGQRRRVLMIEDNPETTRLFERYLEGQQYEVRAVPEGQHALEEVRRYKPDVVLLDIMMGEVDGWQVLQQLKSDEDARLTPVVVCTVLREEELARLLGADGFLSKPISRSQLLEVLGRHCGEVAGGHRL